MLPLSVSPLWLLLSLAAVSSAGVVTAQTSSVVPPGRNNLEGSSSSVYPLGRPSCRYQMLTSALPSRVIRGHAYRRDAIASTKKISAYQVTLSVQLSNSSVLPADTQPAFDKNTGSNAVEALPSTKVSFPSTDRPTLDPSPSFALRIPHKKPFAWNGKGSLCLDLAITANQIGSNANRSFSPGIDAHQLYKSGLNSQPGFVYGDGCAAPGNKSTARATFLIKRQGSGLLDGELRIDRAMAGNAMLILGAKAVDWPGGATGCRIRARGDMLTILPGPVDAMGTWTGKMRLGNVPPGQLFAQVAVFRQNPWQHLLTNASRLSAPPPSPGLIAARVANGKDVKGLTGSRSFAVPVTEFF